MNFLLMMAIYMSTCTTFWEPKSNFWGLLSKFGKDLWDCEIAMYCAAAKFAILLSIPTYFELVCHKIEHHTCHNIMLAPKLWLCLPDLVGGWGSGHEARTYTSKVPLLLSQSVILFFKIFFPSAGTMHWYRKGILTALQAKQNFF